MCSLTGHLCFVERVLRKKRRGRCSGQHCRPPGVWGTPATPPPPPPQRAQMPHDNEMDQSCHTTSVRSNVAIKDHVKGSKRGGNIPDILAQ